MANAVPVQEVPFYHEMSRNELIRVGLIGLLVGVLIPLVGAVIHQWVISPIFCQDPTAGGVCDARNLVGYYIATILVAAVAAPVLIGWGVFRALLIVLGSMLTLWGLPKYIEPLAGNSSLEYYVSSGVLFALCYLLFYWVMRLRSFGLSLVLGVIVVVAVRWALLV